MPGDPRPTQAQVDAEADRQFGRGWREPLEHVRAVIDAMITARLDTARAAVVDRMAADARHRGAGR